MEQNLHDLFVDTFNDMEVEDQVKVYNIYAEKHGYITIEHNCEEFLNSNYNSPFDAVYAVEQSCNYDTTDEYAWIDDYPHSASSILDMDMVDEDELADYFIKDENYYFLSKIAHIQEFVDACIESEEEYEEEEEYDEDYVVGHS